MNNKALSLQDLYNDHSQKVTAKWSSYLSAYDEFFQPYRSQSINLLELGIQNGGSLEIWAKYFERAQAIVGCDIDPLCGGLQFDNPVIHVIIGDITNNSVRQKVLATADAYDIIVDDASHRSGDIIQSFLELFQFIKPGGLYVIEDLHCSYWQSHDGGLYDPLSSLSFFKQCVDVIHHEHWGLDLNDADVFDKGFTKKYGLDIKSDVISTIASITFVNSICIIKKGNRSLGPLLVSGEVESVALGNKPLNGCESKPSSQSENVWAKQRSFDELSLIDMTSKLQSSLAELAHTKLLLEHEKEVSARRQAFMDKTCQQLSDEVQQHHNLRTQFADLQRKYESSLMNRFVERFKKILKKAL